MNTNFSMTPLNAEESAKLSKRANLYAEGARNVELKFRRANSDLWREFKLGEYAWVLRGNLTIIGTIEDKNGKSFYLALDAKGESSLIPTEVLSISQWEFSKAIRRELTRSRREITQRKLKESSQELHSISWQMENLERKREAIRAERKILNRRLAGKPARTARIDSRKEA